MKCVTDQIQKLLLCLLLGCGLAVACGVHAGTGNPDLPLWYLLEFSETRPPCDDVAEDQRCISTRPRTTLFEIRDGERIEIPTGSVLPPVWVEFNRMWAYAPGVAEGVAGSGSMRSIQLDATPLGARLMIEDQNRQYLQSVPVGTWVALEAGNQPTLWVRVSISSPD